MGTLVTLELPEDSPLRDLPWIITFGPLRDDDEWEPLVCGPYERPHALALAETVVADEELMAVVEPLLPSLSADEIRGEITSARLAAEVAEEGDYDDYEALTDAEELTGADPNAVARPNLLVPDEEESEEPRPAPTPAELRAGFVRIAALLTNLS